MKQIVGFSNYFITEDGQVYSNYVNRFLKPGLNHGYYFVNIINDNGESKNMYIHRLVAEAFIPNPEQLSYVNHKDENKTNNVVSNLEWCTKQYNNNYGTHNLNIGKTLGKLVLCVETGKIYYSSMEAERQTGIINIRKACNGTRKTAGGYHWKYI